MIPRTAISPTVDAHPGLEYYEVLVFCSEDGQGGNRLGIVVGSSGLADDECQRIAAELAPAETVFIDDVEAGWLRIHTPTQRIPFAGHPTVGATWLLHHLGYPVTRLFIDAGLPEVGATLQGATVEAPAEWTMAWNLIQVASPDEVNTAVADGDGQHDYLWAWLDEERGLVRARAFASYAGVPEDEATGSAAIALCAQLGRELTIGQGQGSLLHVSPGDNGRVLLTGRVREA